MGGGFRGVDEGEGEMEFTGGFEVVYSWCEL